MDFQKQLSNRAKCTMPLFLTTGEDQEEDKAKSERALCHRFYGVLNVYLLLLNRQKAVNINVN